MTTLADIVAAVSTAIPEVMKMEIEVNGEKRHWEGPVAVGDLLEALGIRPGSVVVERNLQIVPRERLGEEILQDGDSIEIIRLVGGG